jgi:copper(I)-binding protein
MNPAITRRAALQVGVAMGVSTLLPAAHACEFFTTNLRIYRPWTRATAEGDAFAVLCMTFDEVTLDDRLIAVESPVAKHAEMGGSSAGSRIDVPIPAGAETVLSESGTFIRLLGLRHPLGVGRSYPLRLVFERGGVVDADIDVEYERAA